MEISKGVKNKKLITLPSLKNYASREDWEVACWKKISASRKSLSALITFSERHNIVLRAAAANMFYLGKTYKEIGAELLVSPQTISEAKRILKGSNYRSYRERGKTERKNKVYSSGPKQKSKSEHVGDIGFYRRTKYGKVWMPL